jgi:hypothetical protein
MSDATNSASRTDQERLAAATTAREASKEEQPGRILLVPYPKIIFLYPTFVVTLLAAIYMSSFGGTDKDTAGIVVAEILLGVLAVNLVILAFDFPRTTSLTLFFFAVALVMGFILLVTLKPDVLPWLSNVLAQLHPWANAQFYWVIFLTLLVIYVAVFISVRFDYWEVRPNELLHHHGMLANLERLAAPNLRIEKEINDVFEYFLLHSGRLILHASDDRRAIILDNIPFIRKKEEAITRMLGALQVQLREGPG